jgi:hypothetical protein
MALVLKKEEEDEDEDNRKGCTVGRRKRRVRSRRFHVVETTEAVQGGRNVSRVR